MAVKECSQCGWRGMVFRPQTQIRQDVTRMVYDRQGDLMATTEMVKSIIGGIDACPACASRTESDYRQVDRDFWITETEAA